jgi:hypothetical protein
MNEDIQERVTLAARDVPTYGAVVDPVGLKNVWPIVSVVRHYVGAQTSPLTLVFDLNYVSILHAIKASGREECHGEM